MFTFTYNEIEVSLRLVAFSRRHSKSNLENFYVSPESQPAPLSFEKSHARLGLGRRGSRPCDVGLSRAGWFTGACLATVSIAEAAAGAEGGDEAESERFGYAVEMNEGLVATDDFQL